MSSEEGSAMQGGVDANKASSQPKIIPGDTIEPIVESLKQTELTNQVVEPVVESLKQDKDVINPVLSETKLTNQVVEPMSRDGDNATATAAANVYTGAGEEVKTSAKGVGKFLKKFTKDDSMDFSEVSKCGWCCVGLCTCCTACCACLLCIPCLAVTMVLNCLLCPVNTAVDCCCPSRAQPITIRIDDFKSFQSMFN